MAEEIQGTGKTGAQVNRVGVTNEKRIMTDALVESLLEHAASEGRSFNINTGTISLTTATKSAVLYLKNNGDNDLLIKSIGYLIGNSTNGVGDLIPEVIINPSEGTIVSDETPVDININKNFGSSKTLAVDAYKGGEGKTITDGGLAYGSLLSSDAVRYIIATGLIILPKGASIGINITPQASNTAMDLQVFMSVVEQE